MKEEAFRSWLSTYCRNSRGIQLASRTVNSRLSNCRTVERFEGNLDRHFDDDALHGLLERLKYSRSDQNRQLRPRHGIPIRGDICNGTATLRSAVSLYKKFREYGIAEASGGRKIVDESRTRVSELARPRKTHGWPTWDEPRSDQILELARITVPFVRFLHPDIVRAIVEDNESHRKEWSEALQSNGIDPSIYLWDKSPCAFPGVRRYAGSREIAAHRGHRTQEHTNGAIALDDNDYPKQIWSFVFRGKKFPKHGPKNYALAHLADHKDHGNRFGQDFEVSNAHQDRHSLFGLYTCPSNTVYVAKSLIKPTDFDGTIRALLIRRAMQLYGPICKLLPPFLRIPETIPPEWDPAQFKWTEPVGFTTHVPSFLEFRRRRLKELFNAARE